MARRDWHTRHAYMRTTRENHTFRKTSNTADPAPSFRKLNASVLGVAVAEETNYNNNQLNHYSRTHHIPRDGILTKKKAR